MEKDADYYTCGCKWESGGRLEQGPVDPLVDMMLSKEEGHD